MKKFLKLISLLLAVFTVVGVLAVAFSVNVFAAEEAETENNETEGAGDGTTATPEVEKEAIDYVNHYFATPEEKLAAMDLALEKNGICLYVDKVSGEVAYVNNNTGEKLFTNPYDVASSTGNEATKYEILSQIIVTFTDNKGQERVFNSFEEASERGQITVENIKNGVRVEYAIGREQSKILVPRLISMDRFQEMILNPLYEVFGDELYNPRSTDPGVFDVQKMLSYFIVYSVDELDVSKKDRTNMENTFGGLYDDLVNREAQYARALKKFPIIETMPVFVFDPDASESELSHAESIILKYCPEYSYEELEYDHILTEYKADDANPPVFRMALEYKIAEDGLSVRLPANGIRFNESLYTLDNIEVLPYMGAGNSAYKGYNFFPDGSGALFDFQALNANQTRAVSGNVYGTDFAYHEITGTYQKTIRYPVFGIVEESVYYTFSKYDLDNVENNEPISVNKVAGNIVQAVDAYRDDKEVNFCKGQEAALLEKYEGIIYAAATDRDEVVEKRGFVCVIEEGDALAAITTYHAGALSDYNTIRMQFTPRPKDSYVISDSISVGSNDEWTVVSDRKYVGNYMMKYITLSNAQSTKEAATTYDASWFGMAVAYRDYLTKKGVISKLDAKELTDDIPLYIETFGTIETTEKILSIPVTVMAPLTTFEDVKQIYTDLSKGDKDQGIKGIKNINFKLTGYANGGMQYTMPGNLKFERAVGGNDGFQDLLQYADKINKKENYNFGIYPDFDFAYTANDELFDGHTALTHNAKTIDDRYASKRVYSATQQKYENFHEMAISPAYFAEFYNKLKKNYADKYNNIIGISVSTLGNSLNSDFDEDEPYNREDSKEFTVEAFKHFKNTYGSVMTDGGNAYVWKYVDHMLGVSLDSSRYNFASESVPFIGVVLHGSIRFAGEPLNMEGDLRYAMLKAIENGASPYFILAYQNTEVLKEDEQLSRYYSIQYKIWKDDIISTYNELNDVLGDVQDKYIIGHTPIIGATRVPDHDEFAQDIEDKYQEILSNQQNAAELLMMELRMAAYYARKNGRDAEKYSAEAVIEVLEYYNQQITKLNGAAVHGANYYDNLKTAYAEYHEVLKFNKSPNADEKAAYDRMDKIYDIVTMYNLELEICKAAYDRDYDKLDAYVAYKDYAEHKTLIDSVYKKYSDGKITLEQLDKTIATDIAAKLIDDAIEAFDKGEITEDDLVKAIDNYGFALLKTDTLDNAIKYYLTDKLDSETLTKVFSELYKNKTSEEHLNAFKDALAAYLNDTLSDSALDDAVATWFDTDNKDRKDTDLNALKAAIANFKNDKLDQIGFEAIIADYVFSTIDRAEVEANIATLKAEKKLYDKAYANYKFESIDNAELEAAKATFDAAKKEFDDGIVALEANLSKPTTTTSTFTKLLDKFDPEKDIYDECKVKAEIDKTDAENKYNAAKGTYDAAVKQAVEFCYGDADRSVIEALVAEYEDKAEKHNKYLAAEDAFAAVLDTGFQVKFEDCYAIYERYYLNEKYSKFTAILKKGEGSEYDQISFNEFYSAQNAMKALDEDVKAMEVKTGRFDNYVEALAKYDYVMENPDKVTEKEITDAERSLKQTRKTAITNVASINSKEYKSIKTIYETVLGYVQLADEAIYVLAKSENYTIKYNDDKDQSFLNIKMEEDMPYLVKQAVQRAQNAYYAIVEDRYAVINDQRYETNETYNGHKLYRVTLPSGKSVYSYGSYETGYQYLVKNADGTFSLYTDDLSFASGFVNGVRVYENAQGDFGKEVYFTVEGGVYTYYTKVAEGVFVKKDEITYNGTLVDTLDDGTEIYLDGDIYYSVNEDGTYVKYTFSKCIASCYEELYGDEEAGKMGMNANVLATVKAIQENAYASDVDIYQKVSDRIAINDRLENSDDDVEEEEVEESKYSTDNIIVVTYGNDDGSAYKVLILNYNNYAVKVEHEGKVYTIPAYYYVEHE